MDQARLDDIIKNRYYVMQRWRGGFAAPRTVESQGNFMYLLQTPHPLSEDAMKTLVQMVSLMEKDMSPEKEAVILCVPEKKRMG